MEAGALPREPIAPNRPLGLRIRRRLPRIASAGLIALMALILFGPIVLLAVFSFNDSSVISLPWEGFTTKWYDCLLYTSPSPRDGLLSRMPSSA